MCPSTVTLPPPLANSEAACSASGLALSIFAPATTRKEELLPPASEAASSGSGLAADAIGDGVLSVTGGSASITVTLLVVEALITVTDWAVGATGGVTF